LRTKATEYKFKYALFLLKYFRCVWKAFTDSSSYSEEGATTSCEKSVNIY
jgi:hypothetical protein